MRSAALASCVSLAVALATARAAAQSSADVPHVRPAPVGGASTGDVGPGVFRSPAHGALPVRFELRGRGSEPIGVAGDDHDNDPNTVLFTPACATPCTLWFDPGPYVVQLGRSALRERVLDLAVDRSPLRVRFSRDSFLGVASGIAVAGLGVVGIIVGVPESIDDAGNAPGWIALAGAGLGLLASGVLLTAFSLGSSDTAPAPDMARRGGED